MKRVRGAKRGDYECRGRSLEIELVAMSLREYEGAIQIVATLLVLND